MFKIQNRFQYFIDDQLMNNNNNDDEQVDENELDNENFNSLNVEKISKKSNDENKRSRNYWEIPDLFQSSINSSNLVENQNKTIIDNQRSSLITKINSSLVLSNQSTIQSSKQQISNRFPPQPHKFSVRRSIGQFLFINKNFLFENFFYLATHQQYSSKHHYPKCPKNFVQSQMIRGNTKCLSHQI